MSHKVVICKGMSRQPDGWDWVKALCIIGTVAGILAWLSGEKKGGSLAAFSAVTGAMCNFFEPPVCNTCDARTVYDSSASCFRCSKCGETFLK